MRWSCRAILENYAWHPDVLRRISVTWHAGAAAGRNPGAIDCNSQLPCGLQMMRQLGFALFDFRLHAEFDPSRGPA